MGSREKPTENSSIYSTPFCTRNDQDMEAKTRSNPCLDEIVQAQAQSQAQAQGKAKQRPRSAAGRITIAAHLEVQP